jgi:hypothetical protein
MERCSNCGKRVGDPNVGYGEFCDGVMTMDTDPFAVEIHNDYTLYLGCEGSRYESAMDI